MDIGEALYKFYGQLERLIVPKLKFSQDLYAEVLNTQVVASIHWLDLGCGHQLLPWWYLDDGRNPVDRGRVVIGIGRDLNLLKQHKTIELRVQADIGRLPLRDGFLDLVTANMVVEHLDDPVVQFREVSRVLKPGGRFIMHTPNAQGYFVILARLVPEKVRKYLAHLLEGQKEEDVFRTFYRANTPKAVSDLAAQSGFKVVGLRMIVTSALFQNIPPLAIAELVWIRTLMTRPLKSLRTNIIATLEKRSSRRNKKYCLLWDPILWRPVEWA